MTTTQWLNLVISLLAITNPLGNLAIFIGLTGDKTASERKWIAFYASLSVLIILLITSWVGDYLLKFFGISLAAFQLAGAVIVTLIGISMLKSQTSEMSHSDQDHQHALNKESVAVVPLAMPIIAGPGALTAVIISSHRFTGLGDRLLLSLADVIAAAVILIVLFFAGPISRLLTPVGIRVATRVMGLILVAIAMQLLIEGASGIHWS
jgi:multiple antibiotic resistance protein